MQPSPANPPSVSIPSPSTADSNSSIREGKERPLSSQSPPSFFENFLSAFFHEANIRWMLLIGAAIIVASSLMFVTREWKHWDNALRCTVLLAYTAFTYIASQFSLKRFGLRKTAQVLEGLTLLLLPISSFALSWVWSFSGLESWASVGKFAILFVAALFLTHHASRTVLQRWFQQRNLSLEASYAVLVMLAAVPAWNSPIGAFAFLFSLWAVMSWGVIGIHRHAFWLAEQHRLPRIFPFLPMTILMSLFLGIAIPKFAGALPLEWIGFCGALLAITLMSVCRQTIAIFRQRTGNLVFPYPWEVTIPLMVCILMVIAALATSFHGFHWMGSTSHAVVPTSALCAVLLCLLAIDLKQPAFTWAGLVVATIAYQCSPTLFAGLIQWARSTAATMLAEERLPIGFYGCTYLPWLLAILAISRWSFLRDRREWVIPSKHFVTLLGLTLFALGFTHIKSAFLVSGILSAYFALLAHTYRDRRYVTVSLVAIVACCCSLVPFLNLQLGATISLTHIGTALGLLSCGLMLCNPVDRWLDRYTWDLQVHDLIWKDWNRHLCVTAGQLATILTSVLWLGFLISGNLDRSLQENALPFIILAIGLFATAYRQSSYLIGCLTWLFVGGTLTFAAILFIPSLDLRDVACVALPISWVSFSLIDYCLRPKKTNEASSAPTRVGFLRQSITVDAAPISLYAWLLPLADLSFCLSVLIQVGWIWPSWILGSIAIPSTTFAISVTGWFALAWIVFFAFQLRSREAAAVLPWIVSLWACCAAHETQLIESLSTMGLLVGVVVFCLTILANRIGGSLNKIVLSSSVAIAILLLGANFVSLELESRLTSGLCIATLCMYQHRNIVKYPWSYIAVLVHLQWILLVLGLFGVDAWIKLGVSELAQLAFGVILLNVAAGIAFFDLRMRWLDRDVAFVWTSILRTFLIAGLGLLTWLNTPVPAVWILSSFLILCGTELVEAYRRQSEIRLALATACGLLMLTWLWRIGVLPIGQGTLPCVLATFAFGLMLVEPLFRRAERLQFCLASIQRWIIVLPACAVGLSISRSFLQEHQGFLLHSCTYLIAASVYFTRGLQTQHRSLLVASLVLVNYWLLETSWNLALQDLQFYLVPVGLSLIGVVELLKRELPSTSHNPIRYAGAMIVLASPMLPIVHGSWLHLFCLMVLCVVMVVLSIGLRLRALMLTGIVFLFVDLIAMVAHSTMEHPGFLWVIGLATGVGVIALAAFCENQRENIMARIRQISSELATWN